MKRSLIAAALFSLACSAQAATYSFSTPTGATVPSPAIGNISGSVAFETFANADYFTVTLTNTSSPLLSVAQALTGVLFSTSGTSFSYGSVSVLSGQEYFVKQNGSYTSVTNSPWQLAPTSGGGMSLSVFGGSSPNDGVLPMLASYSGTNRSIKNNTAHNPFYLGPVTFEVHTNLASTSGIGFSRVGFEYGTRPQVLAAVPEPETYTMLLAGLGLVGAIARRRKKSKPNQIAS